MADFVEFLKRMTAYLFFTTISIMLLLEVFDYEQYILGWLWGCGINFLYLLVLGLWIYRVRHKDIRVIEKATKAGSAVRLTLVAFGTILAAFLFDNFPFVAYMLGLLAWRPLSIIERIRYNMQNGWNSLI